MSSEHRANNGIRALVDGGLSGAVPLLSHSICSNCASVLRPHILLKDLDGAELSAHAAAALGHLHARAASRLKEILVEKGLIY